MLLNENSIAPNIPDCIDQLPNNSIQVVKNYIGGQFVEPLQKKYLINRNPATNEILAYIPRSMDEDVNLAVKAAKKAHLEGVWRRKTEQERSNVLMKIAAKLQENLDVLAALESNDNGKPVSLAKNIDIPRAVANFQFFAGAILHDSTGCHTTGMNSLNYTLRRPIGFNQQTFFFCTQKILNFCIGICGLITPWNLPLYLLTWKVAPALACGNTVVAKCSELTPLTCNFLAQICDQVEELPKGVINFVYGYGRECGNAIVSHPDVNLISFTGGTQTGRVVGSIASQGFKKLSLELGGKNSLLIMDDCNIDTAVTLAKRACFTNQGEICLCASRVLVQESIYDEFVDKFKKIVQSIKIGDPKDGNSEMGPLISLAHREKIEFYVELAKHEGGQILTGGERPIFENQEHLKQGAFYKPTVIANLSPTSRTSTEEIFGPVVVVHKFKTDEEALEIANNVKYGLCASLCTTNLNRAHKMSENLEVGIVWINTWLNRDLRTPFGGVKQSGVGREGGKYSLEFYSEEKNVCISLM